MGELRESAKKGFERYSRVDEALNLFLRSYNKYGSPLSNVDQIPLSDAVNRVLAHDLRSPVNVPRFDQSAMDGYAVFAEDIREASAKFPVSLKVIGTILPGDKNVCRIRSGQAISVATGSRIPLGSNAVVMVERTSISYDNTVKIFSKTNIGNNLLLEGTDIKKNQIILTKGNWLTPKDIAIAASVGIHLIPVIRRPKVAIFSTGNELVSPGLNLKGNTQIFDSNTHMLISMVNEYGGEAVNLRICKDDKNTIAAKLRRSLQYDMVVISGGSSVGEFDFVPEIISELGKPGLLVHGIAMKPGSPTALGLAYGRPIISVPGFPTSAFFAMYAFGKPLLHHMLGTNGPPENKGLAKMTEYAKVNSSVRTFLRVKLNEKRNSNGTSYYTAHPIRSIGGSSLSSLMDSGGFVIVNGKKYLRKGEFVQVYILKYVSN
jgi:molybdopterin molybdotransferase